ncbi:MAG: UbiA family prenyltransferase [Candidatus Bathyarchaeota archaeon]|nr:UbiA family prenyltransferase [Candidatus Bathyarchaeota archaeon]
MSSNQAASKASALFALGRPFTSLLGAVAIFAAVFVAAGTGITALWVPAVLAFFVGFTFTSASNTLNDYFDCEADKINHPERPLPSGKISPRAALAYSGVLFAVSLVLGALVALQAGVLSVIVVLAALVLELTYDFSVKKRVKAFGNIFIGLLAVLAFIYGGVIVGNVGPVLFMAAAAFLSITAREVVKDVEDMRGDSNQKSLPKIIGVKKANAIAIALLLLAIVLSVVAYYPLGLLGIGYLGVVLVADAVFLCSMPLLFKNPNKARHIWKYAMMLALVAFIVGGIF